MDSDSSPDFAGNESSLHVLTLTPFFPNGVDDAQGCFVAEPLPLISRLGVANTVFVAEPFYRPYTSENDALPASRTRFISFPGRLGLPTAGFSLFVNLLRRVRRLHQSHRIHLIHAHAALPCGHAAALLARELEIPFVITVHGLDAYFTHQVGEGSGKRCERLSKFVYDAAKSVICISERVRDQVLERAPAEVKTEVVYNGVDLDKFRPDSEDGSTQTILCVGNLIPSKGHELLIRSFAAVHAKFPHASCDLIGDGPERSSLMQIASELRISEKIRFLGRRNRQDVAEAMRRSLFFALPSSYEGLGCVYLEAMASGKAAIGCRGQGIEEVIEHGANGWLINPGSVDELTQVMVELLGSLELRNDMGAAARRTVLHHLSLGNQAEQLVRIYRDCVQ